MLARCDDDIVHHERKDRQVHMRGRGIAKAHRNLAQPNTHLPREHLEKSPLINHIPRKPRTKTLEEL